MSSFLKHAIVRWLAGLGLLFALAACATGPRLVPHAFNFDGWHDGWAEQAELLEYSYGDQYRMTQRKAKEGDFLGYRAAVNGPIPVGEFLYVRWRLKTTGEVLEQRVDLRGRLPHDMTDHELTFVIDGPQLYVYVITPQTQPPENRQRTHRTWLSRYNKAYEIFPQLQSR